MQGTRCSSMRPVVMSACCSGVTVALGGLRTGAGVARAGGWGGRQVMPGVPFHGTNFFLASSFLASSCSQDLCHTEQLHRQHVAQIGCAARLSDRALEGGES